MYNTKELYSTDLFDSNHVYLVDYATWFFPHNFHIFSQRIPYIYRINKKAKQLNVPIITEEELILMLK